MKREFQIRIDNEDGLLMLCRNYPTKRDAVNKYDALVRRFKRDHANEEDTFHAEIVEVLHQEFFENEEDGESSEHGSIHRRCDD